MDDMTLYRLRIGGQDIEAYLTEQDLRDLAAPTLTEDDTHRLTHTGLLVDMDALVYALPAERFAVIDGDEWISIDQEAMVATLHPPGQGGGGRGMEQ